MSLWPCPYVFTQPEVALRSSGGVRASQEVEGLQVEASCTGETFDRLLRDEPILDDESLEFLMHA